MLTGNPRYLDIIPLPTVAVMSSLLANALLRTYQVIGDERIPGMLVELARCELDRGVARSDAFVTDTNNGATANMLIPFYIAQSYGEKRDVGGDDPYSAIEHSLDVALPIARGAYFTTDLAQQAQFLDAVRALLKSHEYTIRYWTRSTPDYPMYRLAPPRKYNW